jgi:hypothetical protein
MAAYLMPKITLDRLQKTLDNFGRSHEIRVFRAHDKVGAIIFNQDELDGFGNNGDEPMVVSVIDAKQFEALIPEKENGLLNYVRITSPKALDKLDVLN